MEFINRPSFSSLPLQITLYFSSLYSLLHLIVVGTCALHKVVKSLLPSLRHQLDLQLTYYRYLLDLQKYILIPVIIIWVLAEIVRFYYGFRGNLREKVPDLLTYLLVSVFPQIPLVIYLGFFQEILFPIDYLLGGFILVTMV
jgi:hypothetical protein